MIMNAEEGTKRKAWTGLGYIISGHGGTGVVKGPKRMHKIICVEFILEAIINRTTMMITLVTMVVEMLMLTSAATM